MSKYDNNLHRRTYLQLATGTSVGLLAGCGSLERKSINSTGSPNTTTQDPDSTSKTTIPLESVNPNQFETVINLAEAGIDSSGETPINNTLDTHLSDNTLLYFPPGRYRLNPWKVVGYRNLALVGEDATLVPPSDVNYWLQWGDLKDFRFEGFVIDCRPQNIAPVTYLSVSGGTNVVRNVTVRGHRTVPQNGFEVTVTEPNADLRFENVSLPDGSTYGHAIYVFPSSVGTLIFQDCRIEHWREGLYAAYHSGPLQILRGYYANNGNQQVRVGGGNASAVVRGVTVRVDNPNHSQSKPNMRGIWAEEGSHVRIKDCDVAITDLTNNYSSGAIVVGKQFGRSIIENTRIRIDVDRTVPALLVRRPIRSMAGETIPSMESLPKKWRTTARNLQISGSATVGSAIQTTRRNDCHFANLCIHHPQGSRDGISVSHAKGCVVRNTTIDVGGKAITTEDATVMTKQVQTNESCKYY